jgi:prepilin peptidase CpaA
MVLFFVMILTVLMITVMITDFTRFTIPNKLVLLIFAIYPALLLFVEHRPEWYYDLAIGLALFVFGFVLHSFRLIGGGDVKLLAVCAVFVGKGVFLHFFIGVALWGGALALALLAAREIVPYIYMKLGKLPDSIPRVFTSGQPAPYGLAIAASFLGLLWWGEIAGLKL